MKEPLALALLGLKLGRLVALYSGGTIGCPWQPISHPKKVDAVVVGLAFQQIAERAFQSCCYSYGIMVLVYKMFSPSFRLAPHRK